MPYTCTGQMSVDKRLETDQSPDANMSKTFKPPRHAVASFRRGASPVVYLEKTEICNVQNQLAEASDALLRGTDPDMVDLRKALPPGALEKYCQITGEIDAIHFAGYAAPIPTLLQFANYEQYFDKTSTERYAAATSDPKTVLSYDTGHDLNDPQALQDRYDWLIKYVNLHREQVLFGGPS